MTDPAITLGCGPVDDILDLRHRILRQGLPPESARFEGDLEPQTLHIVARSATGQIVGCGTILRRPWNDQPAWQLRGMAVDDGWRGRGVGSAVLHEAHRLVRDSGLGTRLWCNARVPAIAFYERHGWAVVSDVFDIPHAGPHRRMTIDLGAR